MGSGRRTERGGIDPGEIFIQEDLDELQLEDDADDDATVLKDMSEVAKHVQDVLAREQAATEPHAPARGPSARPDSLARRVQPARPTSAAQALEAARRSGAHKKGKLANRAARPRSAAEALEEARRSEAARKEQARREADAARRMQGVRSHPPRMRTREDLEAERRELEAREAAEQAARDRAAFADPTGERPRPRPARAASPLDALLVEEQLTTLLEQMAGNVEVVDLFVGVPDSVVRPLWKAHAVRARHDGDLGMVVAAEAIHAALLERPAQVVAARVAAGDREWAVWYDAEARKVLAALTPHELYLVGLL